MNRTAGPIGRPYSSYTVLRSIVNAPVNVRLSLLIIGPVIYSTAVFGNVAAFLIMISEKFRQHSYANYLSTLAVTDLGTATFLLLMPEINYFLTESAAGAGIKHWFLLRNLTQCVVYEYSYNLIAGMSTCLVVAIAIERFIVVTFPFAAKTLCTPRSARLVISGLFLFNSLFSLFASLIIRFSPSLGCYDRTPYLSAMRTILSIVLRTVVTYILVSVFNVLIVYRLVKGRDFGHGSSKNAKTNRTTLILMLVCAVFLLTHLPSAVNSIMFRIVGKKNMPSSTISRILFPMIRSVNFSCNFYIYLFGKEVRETFCDAFRRTGKRK
ncbi:G-protein coupled receptor daf-37-like [Tubulanus polymorphus]|uniref:G-protein coupled receptor daf-37-like n=1 Tax=Tubulanus polymorphus TaxID=672921 RepID=UPI003DA43BC7